MSEITTTTQTAIIKPGETFVLPKGATVISIGKDGDVSATSTCEAVQDAIDNAEAYTCYVLGWGFSADISTSPVLEHQDSSVKNITIGGIVYPINSDTYTLHTSAGNTGVADLFKDKLPSALIRVSHVTTSTNFDNRKEQNLYFKTLPSLVSSIVMTISGPGFPNDLLIKPVASSVCTN